MATTAGGELKRTVIMNNKLCPKIQKSLHNHFKLYEIRFYDFSLHRRR